MPVLRFVAMWIAKTLSKVFGLATVTFYGRQPSRDDDKVAALGIASLMWLALLVVAIYPDAAGLVLPEVPGDDQDTRWVAIVLLVVVPPAAGVMLTRMHNYDKEAPGVLAYMALGYLYTVSVGLLTIALIVVVPVVKIGHLLRRFDLEHIAVMVEEDRFEDLLNAVVDILDRHGCEPRIDRANPVIRWIFAGLAWTEANIFRRGVDLEMVVVRGEVEDLGWYEITLHSTDITIIGKQEVSTRVTALLIEELDVRAVYFTWDDASQQIEDELRACREQLEAAQPCDRDRLDELRGRLAFLQLSREEWNVIHRQLYMVERDSERLRADQLAESATLPADAREPAARSLTREADAREAR